MSNIILAILGLGVVGAGVYYVATKPASPGSMTPVAPNPVQNVGYQGQTGDNAYSMLGKVFEAGGKVASSFGGSGFNTGTQEGGVYGSGGDFYGWDY